jgi:alkylation response protein AidB-like acyl-CoA dehydrogenase
MNFGFDESEQLFIDSVNDVVARYITPVLERTSADVSLGKADMVGIYRHLGRLGLTAARTPEGEGGSGLGHLLLGAAMEILPAFIGISLVGHESSVRRISLAENDLVGEKYMPGLVSGERISGTATSEPNVGSDPRSVETRAERSGDHYVLNGTKLWTTNGAIADVLVVVVSVGHDDAGRNLITRIVVDREESPFTTSEVPTIGLRRGHLSEIVFENCRVPAENLLGEPGDAHQSLTATWLGNRPCLGLIAVGLARRALEASCKYAGERRQFGRPIGSFQLIQEILADMATSVDTARLLCHRAVTLLDQDIWAAKETSMAKYYSTEMAVRVTSQAIQVNGSGGLTTWLPYEEWFRDARMLPAPDGSTQIQQLIVGRELTGLRAFS